MTSPAWTIVRSSSSSPTSLSESDTAALHALYESTVARSVPAYSLPASKFHQLLTDPAAVVFTALLPPGARAPEAEAGGPAGTSTSAPPPHPLAHATAIGFALTYTIRAGASWNPAAQHLKGCLSLLIVHPSHRAQGVGTALQSAALAELETTVRASLALSMPPPKSGQVLLGSIFPRIFPGVPAASSLTSPQRPDPPCEEKEDAAAVSSGRNSSSKPKSRGQEQTEKDGGTWDQQLWEAKGWFARHGWEFDPGQKASIDLYQRFSGGEGGVPKSKTVQELEALQSKAKVHGIVFRVAEKGDEKGVMSIQDEFEFATGWPDMFPALFAANLHSDVFIALDASGKIIGATVAALPPSPSPSPPPSSAANQPPHPVFSQLALPATPALAPGCAAIACVGIAASARSTGAGIGLVAAATLSLAARGASGCFIDWVNMVGFYEKAGYGQWERAYVESSREVYASAGGEGR